MVFHFQYSRGIFKYTSLPPLKPICGFRLNTEWNSDSYYQTYRTLLDAPPPTSPILSYVSLWISLLLPWNSHWLSINEQLWMNEWMDGWMNKMPKTYRKVKFNTKFSDKKSLEELRPFQRNTYKNKSVIPGFIKSICLKFPQRYLGDTHTHFWKLQNSLFEKVFTLPYLRREFTPIFNLFTDTRTQTPENIANILRKEKWEGFMPIKRKLFLIS